MAEAKPFHIEYGDRGDVIVARFHGRVSNREVPELEHFEVEISDKESPVVLFDFSDIEAFMPAAHQFFVNFQKRLREKGKILGICGLSKEVKTALMSAGIVRESEIFENLPLAWKTLEHKLHEPKAAA